MNKEELSGIHEEMCRWQKERKIKSVKRFAFKELKLGMGEESIAFLQ